jgi:hypothetical protein
MLTGRKLALTLVFTVLVALAFGVSCRGFFPPNSLTAISIQPPTPQIEVGPANAQTLQAFGTFEDNTRSQITSGVVWTSSDNTVILIVPNTGVATGVNSGGTATITASAQGLSATAQATAYLGSVSGFQVCLGTFGSTSCSSGSTALTWNPNALGTVNQSFVAQGTSGGTLLDLTTGSTWTIAPTPAAGSITCSNSGVTPETCTVDAGTTASPPTYVITVTYGTNPVLTATVNVTVSN